MGKGRAGPSGLTLPRRLLFGPPALSRRARRSPGLLACGPAASTAAPGGQLFVRGPFLSLPRVRALSTTPGPHLSLLSLFSPFSSPWNFWTGGWNDPFGGCWRAGCYWTTILWYGRWSGGAFGCGNFIWDGGSCPPCTYPCGGTQWVPNCCPLSQYNGWTGTCIEQSCDNCFYFDPTYNACVAAPQCGA